MFTVFGGVPALTKEKLVAITRRMKTLVLFGLSTTGERWNYWSNLVMCDCQSNKLGSLSISPLRCRGDDPDLMCNNRKDK